MDKYAPEHLDRSVQTRRHTRPHQAVERVELYVEDHLDGDLSLKVLADVAGLSPFHFARTFRSVTGRTPHRFVMERRVAGALEFLRNTGLSLSEVALECGFASQSHFTTVFRQHVGVTPARYRKSALQLSN